LIQGIIKNLKQDLIDANVKFIDSTDVCYDSFCVRKRITRKLYVDVYIEYDTATNVTYEYLLNRIKKSLESGVRKSTIKQKKEFKVNNSIAKCDRDVMCSLLLSTYSIMNISELIIDHFSNMKPRYRHRKNEQRVVNAINVFYDKIASCIMRPKKYCVYDSYVMFNVINDLTIVMLEYYKRNGNIMQLNKQLTRYFT